MSDSPDEQPDDGDRTIGGDAEDDRTLHDDAGKADDDRALGGDAGQAGAPAPEVTLQSQGPAGDAGPVDPNSTLFGAHDEDAATRGDEPIEVVVVDEPAEDAGPVAPLPPPPGPKVPPSEILYYLRDKTLASSIQAPDRPQDANMTMWHAEPETAGAPGGGDAGVTSVQHPDATLQSSVQELDQPHDSNMTMWHAEDAAPAEPARSQAPVAPEPNPDATLQSSVQEVEPPHDANMTMWHAEDVGSAPTGGPGARPPSRAKSPSDPDSTKFGVPAAQLDTQVRQAPSDPELTGLPPRTGQPAPPVRPSGPARPPESAPRPAPREGEHTLSVPAAPSEPSDPNATFWHHEAKPLPETIARRSGPAANFQDAATGGGSATVAEGAKPGEDDTRELRKVGSFDLARRLGRGAMGEVYEGVGPDGTRVAVKLLAESLGAETLRERFQREGEILARLDHPNVVRLLAQGTDEHGRPYLVLELVQGGDLAQLLAKRPGQRLSPAEAVHVLERCARGLAAAHALGVIHRDVKPGNILVTPKGEIKVSDFGIALAEDAQKRLTAAGAIVGTPSYLAPEAIEAPTWLPAADVYSLGCVAYAVLAGKLPFKEENAGDVLRAHLKGGFPRLADVVKEVPAPLSDLVGRMLSREPAARPTMAEVEKALAEIPQAESVSVTGIDRAPRSLARDAAARAISSSQRVPAIADGTFHDGQSFLNYRIERELGRGGMGIVYRAYHTGLKKTVALKVLLKGALAGSEAKERFLREGEAAGSLKHPYIVPVLDVGKNGDTYYMTMEFIEGQPLSKYLRESRVDRKQLVGLFAKVCEGIHHAHTRGIIHRDLKPDNVIVDPHGDPHILDFGIAKRVEENDADAGKLTTEGSILGTLRYMPPEQAGGRVSEIDVRSDVYALGSILYELVTGGETPFKGTMREILHQIHFAPPRPPSTIQSNVPWELDAICLKALEKVRDDRYQSALELKREAERWLAGHPIAAKRATLYYRLKKLIARNPRTAAALVAVFLSATTLVSVAIGREVRRERARVDAIRSGAASGWERFAQRDFAEASKEFGRALASAGPDDVVVLPAGTASSMPGEVIAALGTDERERPRASKDRLDAWSRLATHMVGQRRALEILDEARKAKAQGRLEDAAEEIMAARKLSEGDRQIESLAAEITNALLDTGEASLPSRKKDRAALDLEGRRSDLALAQRCFEAARRLDRANERAAAGLLEASVERTKLDELAAQTERRKRAAEHLEAARTLLADATKAMVQGDRGAVPRGNLAQARRDLDSALENAPDLDEAKDLRVRVALALGDLALATERVEVAQEELENAVSLGRLGAEVEAFAKRVNEVDKHARAFKQLVDEGNKRYGESNWAGAKASYDLALAELSSAGRSDAPTTRRRDLCQALLDGETARAAGDPEAELESLKRASALADDRSAFADATRRAGDKLYDQRLEAANRAFNEASLRHSGWPEVLALYESALRAKPDGSFALRRRVDTIAERDRPESMILVTVPLRVLAIGAAAATTPEDACLRFYLDQDEVTNEDFARFVADRGYEKRELWTDDGWSAVGDLVDSTGEAGPAAFVGQKPRAGTERLPVTGVSYHEARAFAAWTHKRLPRENEWLIAACLDPRQNNQWRPFPAEATNPDATGLRPPGSASKRDTSPWGVNDMGWNASEWVLGTQAAGQDTPAVRGLSFRSLERDVARGVLEWRKTPRAGFRDAALGFRCAKDVEGQ